MPEHVRAYLYRVCLAVIPILQAYGVIEDEKVPIIIGLVGAVFAAGLATIHTSTENKGP